MVRGRTLEGYQGRGILSINLTQNDRFKIIINDQQDVQFLKEMSNRKEDFF